MPWSDYPWIQTVSMLRLESLTLTRRAFFAAAGKSGVSDYEIRYFGKTLADALPPEVTIGIVGNAISGVDIDFFRKGVRSARRDLAHGVERVGVANAFVNL